MEQDRTVQSRIEQYGAGQNSMEQDKGVVRCINMNQIEGWKELDVLMEKSKSQIKTVRVRCINMDLN